MILFIKDPKNFTKKHLQLINTFSKVEEYKITKKSVTFLYTNDKKTEKEIRNAVPFIIKS